MKPGFTLLELIIVLALAGIIGTALFSSLFFFNQGSGIANQLISIDSKAALVQNQFDKDISGAFIPYYFIKKKESDKSAEKKETSSEKTEKKSSKSEEARRRSKSEDERKRFLPLENAFVMKQKDGVVSVLSFITSNPLAVYGAKTPRIVRVVYRLVPDRAKREEQQSFRLFRQELQQLEFTPPDEVKAQGMLMVNGVKSLKLEFEVRVVEKPDLSVSEGSFGQAQDAAPGKSSDSKSVGEQKQPKVTYETTSVWGPEQIKKYKKQLPNFVIATFSFFDSAKKKSQTFTFRFVVIADDVPPTDLKVSKSKKAASSKNSKPGAAPLGKGKSGGPKTAKLSIGVIKQDDNTQTRVVTKETIVVKNGGGEKKDWCEVPS